MSLEHTYPVIMAGGGGTRLWPLSRRRLPKQSLRLFGDRSLFQLAIDRLVPEVPPNRILVVTIEQYASLLHEQTPALDRGNFILEPSPRGTASAIGYAAVVLQHRDPEAVMACLTADHIIGNREQFLQILQAAEQLAANGEMVTLGVSPSYPSTGYGYIHAGEVAESIGEFEAHRVLKFEEKPSREVAEQFVASSEYSWNSGMFVWRAGRILAEIERQMPELYAGLQRIAGVLETEHEAEVVQSVWDGLSAQTIDYGVMEGAERVVVIPADDLDWLDVGGWDRLPDLADRDDSGNLLAAPRVLALRSSNSAVYQTGSERLIAILGAEDLVVVDTEDVLLICRREDAEGVRQLVAKLSEMGWDHYS